MALLSKPLPPPSRKQILILLASILLLRSSIAAAPGYTLSKLKVGARKKRLTPEELSQALQQIYVTEEDGTRKLIVPYQDSYIAKVSGLLDPELHLRWS